MIYLIKIIQKMMKFSKYLIIITCFSSFHFYINVNWSSINCIIAHTRWTLFGFILRTVFRGLMLRGCGRTRLKSSFCKFYGRYNDLVCKYKLSPAHMLGALLYALCWTIVCTLTLTMVKPCVFFDYEKFRKYYYRKPV
jgi:hypothetical protein